MSNRVHVPVAPRLAGQAHLDYVAACIQSMPLEAQDDPQFEPNSAYWDDQIKVKYKYRLNSFFATEPPSDWFDSDDDALTNTSDEDFWAGVERERVRHEAWEEERLRHQHPLPPTPQQPAEDADDISWPPTPEWDPSHMQLVIAADIAATATTSVSVSAATTSNSGYLYCICSRCRRGPVLAAARAGECPNWRCPACYPSR